MARRAPEFGELGTGPLTPLDALVAGQLGGTGCRLKAIYAAVHRHEVRYWESRRYTSLEDVRLVLRGLEHLGRAEYRNGYWRAL